MSETLSADNAGSYLVDRGVIDGATAVEVRELGGGVSSVVLAVRANGRRLVVKQPLEYFRTHDTWRVKRERVLVEAAALELAARAIPGSVPAVIDLDRDRLVVVIEGARDGWRSWKDELLAGVAREQVAGRVGTLLRTWHDATSGPVPAGFDDPEIFGQQRVDPYYRTTMARRPELASAIEPLLERMLATRTCLVHGDWSPKNVLTGGDSFWVIDWEITHAGDPAFDVAFMTNHLFLKAIHRPEERNRYEGCAEAFWASYGEVADLPYVLGHVGALMVARVDGKSPAEYLTAPQRDRARRLGSTLLTDPPGTLADARTRLRR